MKSGILSALLLFEVFASSGDKQKIKVHIVPHSHMDAGWLSTFDDYANKWVARILTSVTQKMVKNPEYKFTVGDIAFFKNWYSQKKPAI